MVKPKNSSKQKATVSTRKTPSKGSEKRSETPDESREIKHERSSESRHQTPSESRHETLSETLGETLSKTLGETLGETFSEEKATLTMREVDSELGTGTKRGGKFQPWEDRALIKQVLADDPFSCRGESMKRWETISKNLELVQPTPIYRSAISCKSRCAMLIKAHKAEESLSLQKTGTDEEVSNYTRDMDEVVIRSDQHARDPEIKAEAKRKLEELEKDGKKVRDDAMKGQVIEEGSRSQEKSRQYKKGRRDQLVKLEDLTEDLHAQREDSQEQIKDLEKKEEEFRQEIRNFHNIMVFGQTQHTATLESLAAELREESRQRAIEHRELMQAIMAMIHTREFVSGRGHGN